MPLAHPAHKRRTQPYPTSLLITTIVALTATLVGCASGPDDDKAAKAPKVQLVWPEPPNEPRFIFDADLRNQADIRIESKDERLQRILTGRPDDEGRPVYRKPAAIAAQNGRIYVADSQSASIWVFDVPRNRLFRMGIRPPDNVTTPIGLALDKEGRVYALDGKQNRVLVYDSLGLFQFAVNCSKEITKPAGIAVSNDGQRIYVVDRGSVEHDDHKVVAYQPDGKVAFTIGPRGTEPGQVNIPLAAAVGPDDKLHVLDSGNFRIQTFSPDGKYLSSFGSLGNGLGQFSRARSIAADRDGNIYVSDSSFNNVQIFDPSGNLLMWIGAPGQMDLPGEFALIGSIAVDETGRLYITDQYHLKVEAYRRADASQRGAAVKNKEQ